MESNKPDWQKMMKGLPFERIAGHESWSCTYLLASHLFGGRCTDVLMC